MSKDIILEVWGDLACFTRPECKVERMTYPMPTPSAARGILSAIFSKPPEFYWQVTQIETLNPIRYISFKRNEVKEKINRQLNVIVADATGDDGNKGRTQRQTVMLKNVRYRITARIVRQVGTSSTQEQLYEQAIRRIHSGKCFYQPSLGLRECTAYFEESDARKPTADETMDLGIMLYDIFNLRDTSVKAISSPYVTLFRAVLEHGVMRVPEFDSNEVLKPGGMPC